MSYVSSKEIAEKWGITERAVRKYLIDGRISGAYKESGEWLIPEDSVKPARKTRKDAGIYEDDLPHILLYEMKNKVKGGIYHKLQVDFAYNSNHIEGNQLTEDQTVVAQELKYGRITYEQSLTDPRGSVLLQCVGASQIVMPDMFYGETKPNAVYLLCSDGFRHYMSETDLYNSLSDIIDNDDEEEWKRKLTEITESNKEKGEKDNITSVVLKLSK